MNNIFEQIAALLGTDWTTGEPLVAAQLVLEEMQLGLPAEAVAREAVRLQRQKLQAGATLVHARPSWI